VNQPPHAGFPPKASHGFGDPTPEPLASQRHTTRFVLIVGGIAGVGLFNGRQFAVLAAGSNLPLYFSLVFVELLFVWFIRVGIRARGGRLFDLIGRRWAGFLDIARDIILALLFVLTLRACSTLLSPLLDQSSANTAFLLPQGPAESLLWIAVSVTAGVCEELVYRGYLQRQLWALTGRLPLALGLQAMIFALGHAYQGWQAAVITGVYGLAFGLLAAWRKSIIPGAMAHALVDIIGGLFPH
jgi:membrane protease YdiL (CAAX protease family)